jgi:hypothetical protein
MKKKLLAAAAGVRPTATIVGTALASSPLGSGWPILQAAMMRESPYSQSIRWP